uniref:SJCHGC06787 protein n=1 Tax=Schistosoma japonicum TaxID=6182 RepID=Q5BS12_SCHJA|nr:SJCHGC06787 protein [Schistosoma japonicum]
MHKIRPSITVPYIHPNRDHLDQRAIYGFIIYLACFPAFIVFTTDVSCRFINHY